jgi:hypothetical protein
VSDKALCREKSYALSFKINGLRENRSQAIDSYGSYTYPFECVGLNWQKSAFWP